MSKAKPLKLGPVEPDSRPVVDVFGLAYRLRALTRSSNPRSTRSTRNCGPR